MLFQGLYRRYREDGSNRVSDNHSERTRGNSPLLPQGMMQLCRRQNFLALEQFCGGACRLSRGGCEVSPLGCFWLGSSVTVDGRPPQGGF